VPAENVVLTTSCSLLHVPFTTANEEFEPAILNHFAFAVEKLDELRDLDAIRNGQGAEALAANKELFATERVGENAELRARIAGLTEADYTRLPAFAEREVIQKDAFKLPLLPTTTIGSFPQTKEVRAKRLAFRKNELSQEEYDAMNGLNGKKKLDLMCLYTVNSNVTTWLNTSVKTCQVTSSLKTVGCNHMVCVGLNHQSFGVM